MIYTVLAKRFLKHENYVQRERYFDIGVFAVLCVCVCVCVCKREKWLGGEWRSVKELSQHQMLLLTE